VSLERQERQASPEMDASLGLLGTHLRLARKGWCGVRLRANKGIPLLGFRSGGNCMFLLISCFPASQQLLEILQPLSRLPFL